MAKLKPTTMCLCGHDQAHHGGNANLGNCLVCKCQEFYKSPNQNGQHHGCCGTCGSPSVQPAGTCAVCPNCGSTTGCS